MWLARLAVTNKDRSFWFNHLRLILGLSSRPRQVVHGVPRPMSIY